MAGYNAHQRIFEQSDLDAERAFESGTRRVAPPLLGQTLDDDAVESDRLTIPAPVLILAELASQSGKTSMIPVSASERPTVKPPPFRPMVVPVARDESSIPPTRPSLSVRRLESLHRVPFLLDPHQDLRRISLDHREAFVLSRIDGSADIEQVLDATPMPTHRVLNILCGLMDRGLVALK